MSDNWGIQIRGKEGARMRHAYAELVYPNWSLLAGQT